MTFLSEYGLFLAETVTVVVAAVVAVVVVVAVAGRAARRQRGGRGLVVKHLNRSFDDLTFALRSQTMPRKAAKAEAKARRKARKGEDAGPPAERTRVYVLDFHGDLRASQVAALREEVTAVVQVARPGDEVLLRLENPGGTIQDQGLAAAQLLRVRDRGLRLVVAVDKVAASGGYMMACVADRILAAPFAVVGSIGVITEIPNFYRLLDRAGIEFEQVTGGQFKRTVTPFTRTTPEKREKLVDQVADVHALFKEFVARHRPAVDVEQVGTGEYWYGSRAVDLGLVDELVTSDDYLLARAAEADLYAVSWAPARKPRQRVAAFLQSVGTALAPGDATR